MQASQVSPANLVARYKNENETAPMLVLVTGDSRTGKTTWCMELIDQARAAGIKPVGLVSPAVVEQGVKTGIDVVNIASGEHRRLAVKRDHSCSGLDMQPGLPMLNWLLDPEALAWGNQTLEGLPQTGELLILDELGPLEFLTKAGLTEGLRRIESRKYRLVCAVIRPALLDAAMSRWPWGQVIWVPSQPGEVGQA